MFWYKNSAKILDYLNLTWPQPEVSGSGQIKSSGNIQVEQLRIQVRPELWNETGEPKWFRLNLFGFDLKSIVISDNNMFHMSQVEWSSLRDVRHTYTKKYL